MKLVFLHGWSFDATFWQPLDRALGPVDTDYLDQGYTGRLRRLTLPQEPFVAVGHSAGVLWFLMQTMPSCRGIVAINGFSCFTHSPSFTSGHSPRILSRMLSRLDMAPHEVVTRFRRQFEENNSARLPPFDVPSLKSGIEELMTNDGRREAERWGSHLLSIEGDADPLLDASLRKDSFPNARREILTGGHLLPVIAPEHCAALINIFVKSVA